MSSPSTSSRKASSATPQSASSRVGPQYDTTHVYVAPEDFDKFTDSFVATFGGHKSQQGVFQVTPTPSQTMSQLVFTPVGTIVGIRLQDAGSAIRSVASAPATSSPTWTRQ